MEQSLGYLREILSAHIEKDRMGNQIYKRLSSNNYQDEETFVKQLSQDESDYLNKILKEAIEYSKQERDEERAQQLNEVYELLYT